MKTELREKVLKRIATKNLSAFSCYDFTDLAEYKTISKCLERMEDSGEIKRVIQGIYCLNRFDDVLSLPIIPPISDVANCLARKHKWNICPTGNAALNMMGLSNQVPAIYVYLSNGPYKEYAIYSVPLIFKRTMNRELSDYSFLTLLLIQCIKTIGRENVDNETITSLRNKLSIKDRKQIISETTSVQTWIRNIIVEICKE